MKKPIANSAIICIIIVSAFSVWLAGNLGAFGENKIVYDVKSYHSYIPALLIKKDLTLGFHKDSINYYTNKNRYWFNVTAGKKPIIKTTYGLSLLYLPFTIWPILFDKSHHLNGYELPFSIGISISTLFYSIVSLFILYKLLTALRFSNLSIGFTILVLGLGTNLLSYTSIGIGMPHAYDFFLVSCFLYLSWLWHIQPTLNKSILIGIIIGLLILIRPTNILFVLGFLLFKNMNENTRTIKLLQEWKYLLVITFVAFLILVPQLLYWKYITGYFLFNSYVDEHFYFNNPHILQYIFGFRKGWFIYSPLILIGLWGLYYSKKINPFLKATLVIIPLLIFVNSSWWCWWFGGGHGARAMIETYPLIAIGFAAFFDHFFILKKKITVAMTLFLILFNIKSVDLYRANIIHYDSMTRKAFIYTSTKILFSPEDKKYLKTMFEKPDYTKALKGKDT